MVLQMLWRSMIVKNFMQDTNTLYKMLNSVIRWWIKNDKLIKPIRFQKLVYIGLYIYIYSS